MMCAITPLAQFWQARILACGLLMALGLLTAGCTVDGPGSQALRINPLNWGSSEPVVSPSNDYGYHNGVPLDQR